MINESKTEDYKIIRQGNEKWKKCKLLGNLLDTEKNINRRKILAIDAFIEYNFWQPKNQQHGQNKKCQYVASVFLYNSELLTLAKKLENTVNTFQRRHLRKILDIHWPKKITNIELYTETKTERVEHQYTKTTPQLAWPSHETTSRDTSHNDTRCISEESQTTERKTTAHMDGTDQTWSESNRNTRLPCYVVPSSRVRLYDSCCFFINVSSGIVGLISSITDLLVRLAVHGIRSSLLQHHNSKLSILLLSVFRIVQDSQPYSITGKTNAFTILHFFAIVISSSFYILFSPVIAALPNANRLKPSPLQEPES